MHNIGLFKKASHLKVYFGSTTEYEHKMLDYEPSNTFRTNLSVYKYSFFFAVGVGTVIEIAILIFYLDFKVPSMILGVKYFYFPSKNLKKAELFPGLYKVSCF